MAKPLGDNTTATGKATSRGANRKPPCRQCIRARWLLTLLMLASMAVILYLDQFAG